MKKSTSVLANFALLTLALTANAAIVVYDLKTDWSATANPNGTWSYRVGNNLLVNDPFPWVGEGSTYIKTATETLECFFEVGDVLVYPGHGANIVWTAPENGTIDISGSIWPSDPLPTVPPASWGWASWTLLHNTIILSSGDDFCENGNCGGCTGYGDRTAQFDLSHGSGGTAALQNILVAAGDQLVLQFGGIGEVGTGTETGVNFTVTLTPDSVDPLAAIEALADTVVEMNLQNGIENSLDSKLDAALNALVDANVNNDGAACNSLAAFINAVEAQRGNKITHAQADQLIASVQEIQTILNCGN